ncbi:hypothetical protein WR25_11323 isoform D [Diploscapter pachys]|nr:hypothetical protein WR25_11323 isoform D [Diploscapter pachys]
MDCKKGEQCIVVESNSDECKKKDNCRPHAKCITPQKDAPVYTSNSACATVRCAKDTVCQETENGPACVPANAPPISSGCATVLCAQGYNCVDSPSGPSCQEFQNSEGIMIDESQTPAPPSGHMVETSNSGSGTEVQTGSATEIDLSCSMECPPGQACLMLMTACISQPCYPQPTCVELADDTPEVITSEAVPGEAQSTHDCTTVDCASGHTCIMSSGDCNDTVALCSATPECVPIGATNDQETGAECASISCPAGYECQVQTVQCFAAPCPGVASCAKISDGGYPASTNAVDQPLITTVAAPKPVNTQESPSCMQVKCHAGSYCTESNGRPMCINKYQFCPSRKCAYEQLCRITPCSSVGCTAEITCLNGTDTTCGTNEIYRECSKDCEANCENPNPQCSRFCGSPSCQCKDGYVRDLSGNCIEMSACTVTPPDVAIEPAIPDPVAPTFECGEYEEPTECVGTMDCQEHCSAHKMACPMICSQGCACKEGYVRSDDTHACISRSSCPNAGVTGAAVAGTSAGPIVAPGSQCGANETFSQCSAGIDCQPSCVPNKMACPEICMEGCSCAAGYVRNSTGFCILQTDCDVATTGPVAGVSSPSQNDYEGSACSANETFSSCSAGIDCQPSCTPSNTACPAVCLEGCNCAEGYVRNATGFCILTQDCPFTAGKGDTLYVDEGNNGEAPETPVDPSEPQSCGNNEEYKDCKGCEGNCKDPDAQDCMNTMDRACTPGCQCLSGYVRVQGSCYPINRCPHPHTYTASNGSQVTCKSSEIWSECMPQCQQNCRGDSTCADVAIDVCQAGCQCRPNYKRDKHGDCVHSRECYKSAGCTESEVWSRCIGCEVKCGQDPNTPCSATCYSGCGCSTGLVRNSNGQCVDATAC